MTPPSAISDRELERSARFLDAAPPREVIAWALDRFAPQRLVVVTGLQADGVAVADIALALDPSVRILTIDTGRLPQATYDYLDTLRAHWGRDLEVIHPDQGDLDPFASEHGANPFRSSVELRLQCCHIRKVAPLERALRDVDCWMSGLRRGQSAGRAATAPIESDHRHGDIVKLNPLAAWSDDEVHAYLSRHRVPEHPLYALGYRSIGCAPCTRPVAAGEHPRSGRWWWEDGIEKECGIHATPPTAVAHLPGSATGVHRDHRPARSARESVEAAT
ncbi:MAG: phosphoadenylyl-sulfate reductase [Candidatus Dormibacteria bacterium]